MGIINNDVEKPLASDILLTDVIGI